jgi:hypothetical protein
VSEANCITLNHGVIGNGRMLALGTTDTHIDWLCLPLFDCPSVFGRIRWLQDTAFVVEALRRVGHLSVGEAFVPFLGDVAESGPLLEARDARFRAWS